MRTWAGSADAAEQLLRAAGIDPSARGETLGIEAFVRLGEALLERRTSETAAEATTADATPDTIDPSADSTGDADA